MEETVLEKEKQFLFDFDIPEKEIYEEVLLASQRIFETNDEILDSLVKPFISIDHYYQLKEFIFEDCDNITIKGVVSEDKIFGEYQYEKEYWFKYIYIDQKCGVCEDDYYGTIFIPLWFNIEKDCMYYLWYDYIC